MKIISNGGRVIVFLALSIFSNLTALSSAGAIQTVTSDTSRMKRDTGQFEEREVNIPSGSEQIPGTITLPAKHGGRFPIVVLVAGSGPQDRDETVGPNKPIADISHGLAEAGVASIRYDKRTFLIRKGVLPMPKDTSGITLDWEVTNDAVAALEFASKLPEADPKNVFVLGHSLGGTIAPYIARKFGKVRGVILLAPGVRRISVVLHDQALALKQSGATQAQIEQTLAAQKDLFAKIANPKADPNEMISGVPIAYWRDWENRDPLGVLKQLRLPVLALLGGRDVQVTSADLDVLKAGLAAPSNEFHLLPEDNHLFMHAAEGDGIRGYTKPGTVDPQAIQFITNWIKKTEVK